MAPPFYGSSVRPQTAASVALTLALTAARVAAAAPPIVDEIAGAPVNVGPPSPATPRPANSLAVANSAPSPPVEGGEETARTIADQAAVDAPSDDVAASGALRYILDGVEVRGNRVTAARIVTRLLPFAIGEYFDVADPRLETTRFRLLGTGYFRDAQLSLRRGRVRGHAILVVSVVERNTFVVNDTWLGLSTDAEPNGRARPLSAFAGIDVAENNLGGSGIALGGAVAFAERQLALRTRYADPDFLRTNWSLDAQLTYAAARDFFGQKDVLATAVPGDADADYAVLGYRRFGGRAGVGHDVFGPGNRLFLDWRVEGISADVPPAASHKRGDLVEPILFPIHPGRSLVSSVAATFVQDTRDAPVLPTRGHHLSLFGEAGLRVLGSDYAYGKFVARGSQWFPLRHGHVLRLEGFLGVIAGDAPLYDRFYVGDFSDLIPDRVLDLAVDRRAAPNFFGTTIGEVRYGTFAARAQAEYRIPLYRGRRSIYGIDLFGAAGLYAVATDREFTEPARGYSALRRVPIDTTFNVGLRVDTSVGGFVFGTSTLVGLFPLRREAP